MALKALVKREKFLLRQLDATEALASANDEVTDARVDAWLDILEEVYVEYFDIRERIEGLLEDEADSCSVSAEAKADLAEHCRCVVRKFFGRYCATKASLLQWKRQVGAACSTPATKSRAHGCEWGCCDAPAPVPVISGSFPESVPDVPSVASVCIAETQQRSSLYQPPPTHECVEDGTGYVGSAIVECFHYPLELPKASAAYCDTGFANIQIESGMLQIDECCELQSLKAESGDIGYTSKQRVEHSKGVECMQLEPQWQSTLKGVKAEGSMHNYHYESVYHRWRFKIARHDSEAVFVGGRQHSEVPTFARGTVIKRL